MTSSGGYRPRVLIVEDEYIIAQDVARLFASKGAHIIGFAPSVRLAREIVFRDVAVLDVSLADTNSFELAELILEKGACIVFYTAAEPSKLPDRFNNATVVQKPASIEELYSAVIDACGP